MSFAEVIMVLAFLGIMAFISILVIQNVVPASKETTATANLNELNSAIHRFNQSEWELVLTRADGSSEDELAIFRSLQYRHPTRPAPGSPFLSENLAFFSSNDEETYRAIWNGRQFEMVGPGTSGTGLDLNRMVETSGSAQFDNDYTPVGAH